MRTPETNNLVRPTPTRCPQLPGTLIRINIPPGAVINLLNLIEITSPGGVCLILRIPILGGSNLFSTLTAAIEQAGGKIEVVEE
ncbi:hypothetical protein CACET_c07050 [Clostridium aceticum]|uniref:Uncharacterized protein n=1 Tax=Clostridium aceticum TaxID=84022 RepID=A0A0D8IDU5_9CLOT|nr:hypothetical protein [Clostridium aceticum]AKL94215.1 hypothetical protein CACET_c07050 [Clostridium aceticum]KJF28448.1 hypothetical protein TZ02_00500 [Clostridium aceticum]